MKKGGSPGTSFSERLSVAGDPAAKCAVGVKRERLLLVLGGRGLTRPKCCIQMNLIHFFLTEELWSFHFGMLMIDHCFTLDSFSHEIYINYLEIYAG